MSVVFDMLIESIGYSTGQVLLYILTLGKRKPRWPYDRADSAITQELKFTGSAWLGYLFWTMVIAAIFHWTSG
jgi:hypothetical protein